MRAGVTTVLDAGSAGCNTFEGFPLYIIPNAHTEIVPFLHIGRSGQTQFPDILGEASLDLESTANTIKSYPDLIRGLKIRMTGLTLELIGTDLARRAKQVANECGVPLMMHIGISGDTTAKFKPDHIRDLLPVMEKGDIVTHCYSTAVGGMIDDTGKPVPEAKESLRQRCLVRRGHRREQWYRCRAADDGCRYAGPLPRLRSDRQQPQGKRIQLRGTA